MARERVYHFCRRIQRERHGCQNLWRSCILIGLCAAAVFLAVSFLLARWAVKPVERAWTQQKQFVSDASHELKTPLTVILTNAEMLRDPSYSGAGAARFAKSILTMSHQMRGLVESLLELARVDNGAVKKVFEALDWSSLVQDAVLPFEALFFEKGLTLQTDIEPGITVRGSAQHLRQCAEILLDNAVKYSAPGTVRVALKKTGHDKCALSVATPGEPLSPEECKKRVQALLPGRRRPRHGSQLRSRAFGSPRASCPNTAERSAARAKRTEMFSPLRSRP